jgi:hypothetical protein
MPFYRNYSRFAGREQREQNELKEKAARIHCERIRLALRKAESNYFTNGSHLETSFNLLRAGRRFKSKTRLLHLFRTGL